MAEEHTEDTPAIDAEDVKSGEVTITDMKTGEVVSAPESSIPGQPMEEGSEEEESGEKAPSAKPKPAELTIGKPAPILGKKWRGQQFVTTRSVEDVEEEQKLQQKYNHKNAIPIEAYFVRKGVRDPVKRAAMKAYTKVRNATVAAFDEIFAKF